MFLCHDLALSTCGLFPCICSIETYSKRSCLICSTERLCSESDHDCLLVYAALLHWFSCFKKMEPFLKTFLNKVLCYLSLIICACIILLKSFIFFSYFFYSFSYYWRFTEQQNVWEDASVKNFILLSERMRCKSKYPRGTPSWWDNWEEELYRPRLCRNVTHLEHLVFANCWQRPYSHPLSLIRAPNDAM